MSSYYNDNETYCCKVISKNIQHGFLPVGYVDERSIQEVQWDDIASSQHVHLFAGIGGFALGMLWAGYPLRLRTMTGGFPCTNLSLAGKREGLQGEESGLWSEMARLISTCAEHDVWYDYILIENVPGLLSGGHYDDEETTQEEEECNAVQDGSLCPSDTGCMGDFANEPVFQSWMGVILADLAQAGYDATWTVLRASDFGAPHRRERVFIVAYPNRERSSSIGNRLSTRTNDTVGPSSTHIVAHSTSTGKATAQQQGLVGSPQPVGENVAHSTSQQNDRVQQPRIFTNPGSSGTNGTLNVAHPDRDGQWNGANQQESGVECEGTSNPCIYGSLRSLAHSTGEGSQEWRRTELTARTEETSTGVDGQLERCCAVAYPDLRQRERSTQLQAGWEQVSSERDVWSNTDRCSGDMADAHNERCEEQHASTIPREQGRDGRCVSTHRPSRTTECRVCRGTHGLSTELDEHRWPAGPGHEQYEWEPPRVTGRQKHRIARLKALGNSVVPQCVQHIARCILAYEYAKEEEVV